MPKGNAARFIARDIQKNREKRRKRIKTKANTHQNQHEFLRISTRKKMQKRHDNDSELLMSQSEDDFSDLDDENKPTATSRKYEQIMKDPAFLLSMQPRMFEDTESEDE